MPDFIIARKNMVSNQLKVNNITENNLLDALGKIPREIFLHRNIQQMAYLDKDINIFTDRFLINPINLGKILKVSKIKITDRVLDLACATGYTSTILGNLSTHVYAVDNKNKLIQDAKVISNKLDITNVTFICASFNKVSFKEKFDIIFIFGGVQRIPVNIFDLMKEDGGKLVTIMYGENNLGNLITFQKIKGVVSKKTHEICQTPILGDFKKTKKEFIF